MNLRESAKYLRSEKAKELSSENLLQIWSILAAVCDRLADIAPAADRHDDATKD